MASTVVVQSVATELQAEGKQEEVCAVVATGEPRGRHTRRSRWAGTEEEGHSEAKLVEGEVGSEVTAARVETAKVVPAEAVGMGAEVGLAGKEGVVKPTSGATW